eukprot:15462380-Alexandrium_andersonii.AAC.1
MLLHLYVERQDCNVDACKMPRAECEAWRGAKDRPWPCGCTIDVRNERAGFTRTAFSLTPH